MINSDGSFTSRPFSMGTEKEAALKPLEEAAEAFGAWQEYKRCPTEVAREHVYYECCDTIQAAANLMSRIGATERDFMRAFDDVELNNSARGRYEGQSHD